MAASGSYRELYLFRLRTHLRHSQYPWTSTVGLLLATGALTGLEGLYLWGGSSPRGRPWGALSKIIRLSSSCQQIRHLCGSRSRLRQFFETSSDGIRHSLGSSHTSGAFVESSGGSFKHMLGSRRYVVGRTLGPSSGFLGSPYLISTGSRF